MLPVFLADAGIPMLSVQWPLMAYALAPVIAVELFVFRRALRLSYKSALLGATLANIVSTTVGFPIAWGISFAIELGVFKVFESAPRGWSDRIASSPLLQVLFFPLGAAWLNPLRPSSYWVVACAAGILLIPTFFLSVWLERFVCRWIWRTSSRAELRRATYSANLVSYALLFLAAFGWGIYLFCAYRHS